MFPYRERSYACIHPHTFKYYFERSSVIPLWRALSARFGGVEVNRGFNVMQIDSGVFLLRAVIGGNPITVIRKRDCGDCDIASLHEVFGYSDASGRA
jgi:hypothetical protein